MNILITGIAGFIGFNFARNFLKNRSGNVIGIDNINDYYSKKLKKDRLKIIKKKIKFYKVDLSNFKKLNQIFKDNKISIIYHFAAQAGVRFSIDNPTKYQSSNINGFFNLIELSRKYNVKKIIYASSSSVYGDVNKFPITENKIINPKNFYGLSKKINEEMAEIYSRYYNIKFIGLRFFTVYGEWGRPDMSIFKIIQSAFTKKMFYLNNFGKHYRDFTYIQDCINIIMKLKFGKKKHEIYNVCSGKPISLLKLIKIIAQFIKLPKIIRRKKQIADVFKTHGSNKKIFIKTKHKKITPLKNGIENTVNWYKEYYNV
jgi:UDP-glucuronate 4-epimerase